MIRKIEFPHASLQDLENIHLLLDEMCHHAQWNESICYAVRLAIEEAYVNVIDHGYAPDQPGPIAVTIESNTDQIAATIADQAPAFAPEDAPRPDLQRDVDERQIGGLGWHFIREMMDEIRYESDDGKNRLTLVKHLHPASQGRAQRERLEITISSREGVTVVAIGGEIDALTVKSTTNALKKQLAEGKTRIVTDLGRVSYMSSAGVFALLQTLKQAREHSGDLRVANAHKQVRKVLDLSGFSEIAKFYPDVDSAVESFENNDK